MLRQLQFLNDLNQKKIKFQQIQQLMELSTSSKAFQLEQLLDDYYQSYLQSLSTLPSDVLTRFLSLQMEEELVTTQRMEDEKSFLIRMYMKTMAINPLAYAREQFEVPVTLQSIQQIHNELMFGTSQDGKNNYEFRKEEKIVAHYKIGETMKVIYNPPSPFEIEACMNLILPLFHYFSKQTYFINAFKLHAFIGIIQPFQDGNSRLARTIQYAYLSKITELFFDSTFQQPTFYYTNQYAKDPIEYRQLIGQLALQRTQASFDDWYTYNANLVIQQLAEQENQVKILRKRSK